MTVKTIYREVDINIDLSDFTDQELLEELSLRGIVNIDSIRNDVNQIYEKRRLELDYNSELSILIYKTLGKII